MQARAASTARRVRARVGARGGAGGRRVLPRGGSEWHGPPLAGAAPGGHIPSQTELGCGLPRAARSGGSGGISGWTPDCARCDHQYSYNAAGVRVWVSVAARRAAAPLVPVGAEAVRLPGWVGGRICWLTSPVAAVWGRPVRRPAWPPAPVGTLGGRRANSGGEY